MANTTSSNTTEDGCYRPLDHVASVIQAGYTVLLDVMQSRYYSLDPVGGRIWSLLCEGRDLQEIVSVLAQEYAGDTSRIAADVSALIGKLLTARLVEATN
jgi:hypothetical protein